MERQVLELESLSSSSEGHQNQSNNENKHDDEENDNGHENMEELTPPQTGSDSTGPPLDERILSIVKSCKGHEIRPARLATELGISINDACAELCGLLQAVGKEATFRFEQGKVDPTSTSSSSSPSSAPAVMVFTFPPGFDRMARRARRRKDLQSGLRDSLDMTIRILKIITAFGLILSLLILCVAAMVGLIAAIVAMSRSNHGGRGEYHRALVLKLRSLFFTMRQLLWCYAMFGHSIEGQDPFLREIAYDLALLTSFCGPVFWGPFFWMRAYQMSRRRHRFTRGWGNYLGDARGWTNSSDDGREGVSMIRRGSWGRSDSPGSAEQQNAGNDEQSSGEEHSGLLSVAVEFLFGPHDYSPGPSDAEKWQLRGSVILTLCIQGGPDLTIELEQLSPFVDASPKSLKEQSAVAMACLTIVTHFNGIPTASNTEEGGASSSPSKAIFSFPELLAESEHMTLYQEQEDEDNGTFDALLFKQDVVLLPPPRRQGSLPSFLRERRFVLTRLESSQFKQCVILGVLNLVGVLFLRQSLGAGGVLEQFLRNATLVGTLKNGLCPVLSFYAWLFCGLPIARLIWVLWLNFRLEKRNERRSDLARELEECGKGLQQSLLL